MSGRPLMMGEIQDRFWAKVDKSGECWLWTAARFTQGYGCVSIWRKVKKAHRVAWEWENGPVPDGLQLDHLCFNKLCVRPDHLEPVTPAINARRATYRYVGASFEYCKRGHPRNGTTRACVECRRQNYANRNAADHVRRARRGAGSHLSSAQERERLGRILLGWREHGYESLEAAVSDLFDEREVAA